MCTHERVPGEGGSPGSQASRTGTASAKIPALARPLPGRGTQAAGEPEAPRLLTPGAQPTWCALMEGRAVGLTSPQTGTLAPVVRSSVSCLGGLPGQHAWIGGQRGDTLARPREAEQTEGWREGGSSHLGWRHLLLSMPVPRPQAFALGLSQRLASGLRFELHYTLAVLGPWLVVSRWGDFPASRVVRAAPTMPLLFSLQTLGVSLGTPD